MCARMCLGATVSMSCEDPPLLGGVETWVVVASTVAETSTADVARETPVHRVSVWSQTYVSVAES